MAFEAAPPTPTLSPPIQFSSCACYSKVFVSYSCLTVSGVALAFSDDVVEMEIGSVVGLDVENPDELGLERVLGRRVHHLVFDLGVLRTESDEDQFVASNSFARREPDVITGVAAISLVFDTEQIVGEFLVFCSCRVTIIAGRILELFVHLDALQICAQLVDDAIVGLLLLHVFKFLDTVIHDGHA